MPTLIVLLGWPLLEIAGFVWIGPYLGVAGTVAFVVTSAIVGMALLRREGIGLLMRIRRDVAARVVPVPTAVDGACRIAAALLLVVPGFFSTHGRAAPAPAAGAPSGRRVHPAAHHRLGLWPLGTDLP